MYKELHGYSLLGELPGAGPWRVLTFRSVPVFVSQDHGAYMVIDGKLWPVDIGSSAHEWFEGKAPTLSQEDGSV